MTGRSPILLAAFIVVVCYGSLAAITAAPGDLDTTFAGTGFARDVSALNSTDTIYATAIQADGKILALGSVSYGETFPCAILRYNTDGSLDTSFDGDGRTLIRIGAEFTCGDIAVQADGKIVVVGYIRISTIYNVAIFRYNSDGSPDTSFDLDGRRTNSFINADFAYNLAIQADGKILVCGNVGDEFLVIRYNADGSFDTSFDGDGWVATDFFGGADRARALAIQADGKIVVAGNGRASGSLQNDFAVARYNTDGSLDTSFDGDGKVLTDFAGNHDNALDIVIQTDGKILVGGNPWGSNTDIGLARYNADGSPDNSFDGDGKVSYNIWAGSDYLYEVAIRPDGKIYSFGGGNGQFALVRYNANGSLDTTLDGDGSMSFPVSAGFSNGYALELLGDGKLIVAGMSHLGSILDYDFTIARLNPDVTFDISFDGDGKVYTNLHKQKISANGVAIQPDGKIVSVGYFVQANRDQDFAVYRYNPNGTLDTSFGGDGGVSTDFGTFQDAAYAVAIQLDGKIVVAGRGNGFLALARYNTDGSLDTSFNGTGRLTESGQVTSYALAVAIQPDGRILMAGRTFFIGYASTIFRYNPDGSRDNSFDSDGMVRTDLGGDDEISSIGLQPDGKIVVAGTAQGATYDFMIGRYNTNGTLDTSFDTDGITTVDFVGGFDNVNALALQSDGKIVVAGASSGNSDPLSPTNDSALVRLNPDGSMDSSFDGDGRVRATISIYFDSVTGLALETDGKILTSGTSLSLLGNSLGTNDFVLARYNPNGSVDLGYGDNGKAITDLFVQDLANDLVLDSSGRAVVVGATEGYFTVARFLGGASSANVQSPFDFDGDGKSDISIFRPSSGLWWYLRSSDGQVNNYLMGNSADRIVPADYTGDAKTDVAVWRPSTGEWFVLRSEDHTYYAVPFGTSNDLPAPADFDNDRKADLAVFRQSSGTWYIKKSTGTIEITNFGQNGDVPTVGDFDGDGTADLAIFRVANGQWWQRRSTTGIFVTTFGTGLDLPVVGDYTGDARTDIAFWRPATGEWFVLRSEDLSYYSVPFGASGDRPTPGDYDGDGRFDTAVFRPSNLNWYINRTTSGLLIRQFGSAGDRPVPAAFVP